jgi:predicted ATP-binding protein involved in virulence
MNEFNILIVAPTGYGKSNLADAIRNAIFKADINAHIHVDDHDREKKDMGDGINIYNIVVRQKATEEDAEKADVVVNINNKKFINKYHEII